MENLTQNMLARLNAFAKSAGILNNGDQILLTVSGGIDSVVLAHLLAQKKLRLGIAHCNFTLRGAESDEDEIFVQALAKQLGIPFYVISFNTKLYAEKRQLSIQMAARELRYTWFEETRKEAGYHFIATAHHKNDSTETMLLNMAKGTGIKGLHGILPKQGTLVRPLLCFTKAELLAYAKANNLTWREDVSNAKNTYQRNLIRNKIVPEFESINPEFINTAANNMQRFREVEQLYNIGVTTILKKLVETRPSGLYIPINKLLNYSAHKTLLHEFLIDKGFNNDQLTDLTETLTATEAKQFLSSTHRVIKDRKFIILAPLNNTLPATYLINSNDNKLKTAYFTLSLKTVKQLDTNSKPDTIYIDADKIDYPLTLRPWTIGDYFYPLGMTKKKKVSRFLIDNKLNPIQKEQTFVLESGDKVVWVLGMRLDERFKVTYSTKNILQINCTKKAEQ